MAISWCHSATKPVGVYAFAGNVESDLNQVCHICIKYSQATYFVSGTTCQEYWNGQSPPNDVHVYNPGCLAYCNNLVSIATLRALCWTEAQRQCTLNHGSLAEVIDIYTVDEQFRWSDNCYVYDIRLTGYDWVYNLPL